MRMKPQYLRIPLYLGISTIIIGSLYKLQHWEFAKEILFLGNCIEIVFFILVFIDIVISKSIDKNSKGLWLAGSIIFSILLFFFTGLLWAVIVYATGSNYLKLRNKPLKNIK